MANRREEEREQLRQARQEREAEQAGSERRRLVVAYAIGSTVLLAVIVAVVILATGGGESSGGVAHINQESGSTNSVAPDERAGPTPPAVKVSNLKKAAKLAGCVLRLHLKDEGHNHLPAGSPPPHYKTNPPTSGNHVEPPYQQADGAYRETPEAIDFVHSLEHGRMEIEYKPSLPEDQQLELKGLYDTLYGGTLLFPNGKMPFAVAAATWTNLLGCKVYKGAITLDAIRDFGKATWGLYGGEPVNGFAVIGPTPVKPAE